MSPADPLGNPSSAQRAFQNFISTTQATHILGYGGSGSGKTFFFLRQCVVRALKAPGSSHAVFRFRLNHLVSSVYPTFERMLQVCFPGLSMPIKGDHHYAETPNHSRIWFGGLDDKERTEKVLGQEHCGIYLNEASQIPFSAREMAVTRLRQAVEQNIAGRVRQLKPRMYYDCNPPSKGHWLYRMFVAKEDPISGNKLLAPDDYAAMQLNPRANEQNLTESYLKTLEQLSERTRKRFLLGEFAEANPNALWTEEVLERNRVTDGDLPDMQRIIIGVDPSGSGDTDNADNDEIGIVIASLGSDGYAYVCEDLSIKCAPERWGNVVKSAYERHMADLVVGEANFGGDMVRFVVQAARPGTPFKAVTASRGKVVRAEPISALYAQGKIRHVGEFKELEDELLGFSTTGYMGQGSPNRADALIWALSELFPGIARREARERMGRPQFAEM